MRLKKVDLTKAKEHECPGIKFRTWYLAKIRHVGGRPTYEVGKFHREWYGLNFDCEFGEGVGLQFDAPGYNASPFVALWEIVDK